MDELGILMTSLGRSVSRQRLRFVLDRIEHDVHKRWNFEQFRQFIRQGYARELLMMDITRDIVYSNDQLLVPDA
jgi:hypothetical protein